jgi:AMMECR1 domain-containing protein
MTTMIVELYEALRAAGAPEDKAQAAAKAAEHDRRFGSIETELAGIHAEIKAVRAEVKVVEGQVTMVKWVAGATFAGVLALTLRTFIPA